MVRSKLFTTLKFTVGAALLSLAWNVQAAPLGLTLADAPDIAVGFITVSYDAASDTLSAAGFALQYDGGGAENTSTITGGLYTLTATIDDSGNLLGGSFTISGTIPSLGANSGTLLTGVLTDFGFNESGGDPLEFLFAPTGGDLAPLYSAESGIIMSFTGFGGSFTEDFENTGTGVADVAAIPVPAAVWLMLSAMAGLIGIRRRK